VYDENGEKLYFTKTQQDIVDLFNELDTDRNGNLNISELRQAIAAAGVSIARLDKLFHVADLNGDGMIDFDEFMSMMRSHGAPLDRQARKCEALTLASGGA